ncbi:MAG: nicotinate-nucleotide adenylyltransferase [Rhodospirillaceae bacterium]|nr:nicotinate-nucleotide adenylyltransferase [Rhodospirillaceae bacterium]
MTGRNLRVGILGGSFNPAHDGHLHVSQLALDQLELDELWWLVSPQNPLKPVEGMAPFAKRFEQASVIAARDGRIRVSDFENQSGTIYSVDTIAALKKTYPDTSFVWVVGADNLRQMPKWQGWQKIFRSVPIAVFPRVPFSLRALRGRAARRFAGAQIQHKDAARLAGHRAPAWVMLQAPLNLQSATRIRKAESGGWEIFPSVNKH